MERQTKFEVHSLIESSGNHYLDFDIVVVTVAIIINEKNVQNDPDWQQIRTISRSTTETLTSLPS